MKQALLRIWYNMNYPAAATELLKKGVTPHQLIFARSLQASNLDAGAADPQLADADVAFGQPNPDALLNLPKLKWVHLTSAGYERYDRADLRSALSLIKRCTPKPPITKVRSAWSLAA